MQKNLTPNGEKLKAYFSKGIFSKSISDQEFDNILDQEMRTLQTVALDKLSLDIKDVKDHQPVWVYGPPDISRLGGVELDIKKGKDDFLRYLPIGLTIYFFAEHSLLAYQCTYDPTTGNALNENTFEFFYNEIVSFETISTSSSIVDYNWSDKIIKNIPVVKSLFKAGEVAQFDHRLQFVLTTTGGTKLPVTLTEDILTQAVEGGKFSLDKSSKSINIVRRTVRQKKSYTLRTQSRSY